MNLHEITVTRNALRQQLKAYDAIVTCCHSCEHYDQRQCIKFEAPPPPEWIKEPNQCEHWEYDAIPF
jgi:hypothetical protein